MAKKKTHEEFVKELFDLVGDEYTLLNKYETWKSDLLLRHNKCGREYIVRASNFLSRRRCKSCTDKKLGCPPMTHEEFVKRVYEEEGNKYIVVGKYISASDKILMRHEECGNEYEVRPYSFKQGKRCPYCKSSKGEVKIVEWMNKRNVDNKIQYTFADCIHKGILPFDFAVFNNDSLIMLIEFDGRQHFEPIDYWGGEEGFKEQKLRDSIKDDYCKKNNITLLRIPYWDFDKLEDILEEKIHIDG